MAGEDVADPIGQDETDFFVADFLVQEHGLEQSGYLASVQRGVDRQSDRSEQISDPFAGLWFQPQDRFRESGRRDLADRNGFAVQIFAVTGDRFQGVADRVPVVEDSPQALFLFVLGNDFGLDPAALGDDLRQGFRFLIQDLGILFLEQSEQPRVSDDAVFDDFGHSRSKLPRRQSSE